MKKLNESEKQIVLMLANGMTAKQISEERGTSTASVNEQVKSSRLKLGAENSAQLVALSIKIGYIDVAGIKSSSLSLSPREVEILGWLRLGMSNNEIKSRTGVTLATVKAQVASIMKKTGCTSRAKVVAYANLEGYGA